VFWDEAIKRLDKPVAARLAAALTWEDPLGLDRTSSAGMPLYGLIQAVKARYPNQVRS
jgi:hypothetical protein